MHWTSFDRSLFDPCLQDEIVEKARTTQVTVLKNVLDPRLHKALKTYVRALKEKKETELRFDDNWGGRWTKNNDPFICMLHDILTPVAYSRLKLSIKPSYNFLSCYINNGIVPKHTDRPQCKYTLDYMVDQSEGLSWELFVCGEPIILNENDAVIYSGTDMLHWRNQIPESAYASLIFFHFVDNLYSTDLD